MSATAATNLISSKLRVTDDLIRESLPRTHRDPMRKVAWMNAMCATVLTIGVVLTKKPSELAFHPEVVDTTPVEIPVFQPELTTAIQQPQDQVEESTDKVEPVPAVATPVIANTPDVAFGIEVKGPTIVVKEFKYSAPPPREVPKALPSRPSGPQLFAGDARKDGGFYPKVDYPQSLIRLRESGEVRMHATIAEDGSIEKLEVMEPGGSSGFSALDRHAVTFIRRNWRWPAGRRREYIIPVEFKITQ